MPEPKPIHFEKLPTSFSESWGKTLKGILCNRRLANHLSYRQAVVRYDPVYADFKPENERVNINAVNLIKNGNISSTLTSFLNTKGALSGYSYQEREDTLCESFSTVAFGPNHQVILKYDKKNRKLKEVVIAGEEDFVISKSRSRRTVSVILDDNLEPVFVSDLRAISSFSENPEIRDQVIFEKKYLWVKNEESFTNMWDMNDTVEFNAQIEPDNSLLPLE
ncbi:hypothetical protein HZA76_04335 [Candidatus Roizmanbacteria bacterium]|nr:hypothetical protein [Candidatus Roizmanbacteria bacterium]